jgi:hypothetical protein
MMDSSKYFKVYRDTENPDDIAYEKQRDLKDIPDELMDLRDDVDKTLTTIRMLFLQREPDKFEEYFRSLLSLAQVGLVGDSPSPRLATRALTTLKHDILAREGGRIKNRYMIDLGKKALLFILPAIFLVGILEKYAGDLNTLQSFIFLWIGCMGGVWLSFGTRKIEIKFEELNILEKDRLNPSIRLIFAGLLTIVIGLLVSTKAVDFVIGEFSAQSFVTNIEVALLLGLICGLSEKVLSTTVAQKASDLFVIKKE